MFATIVHSAINQSMSPVCTCFLSQAKHNAFEMQIVNRICKGYLYKPFRVHNLPE